MKKEIMDIFFKGYFNKIDNATKLANHNELIISSELITKTNQNGGKVIIVGNGGSASIASHVSIDFTKAANIRAITFNESSLITCFANDYGYQYWVENALEFYAEKNDIVILISSSGESDNILNGANKVKELGLPLITFSGFSADNRLRKTGDINFWVDSESYNLIEIVHQTWILSIVDFIIYKDL
jgi:D-sedoheptulose 7-phosphate isomerase